MRGPTTLRAGSCEGDFGSAAVGLREPLPTLPRRSGSIRRISQLRHSQILLLAFSGDQDRLRAAASDLLSRFGSLDGCPDRE